MKKSTSSEGSIQPSRFRPDSAKRLDFMPGKMIVKIKSPALNAAASEFTARGARMTAGVRQRMPESVTKPFEYLANNVGLKSATSIFSSEEKRTFGGAAGGSAAAVSSVASSLHEDLGGFTVVDVDAKKITPKLMRQLSASSAIQFVEPMPARWLARRTPRSPKLGLVDPMQKLQWNLGAIGWPRAKLPTQTQASRVKIAVLDSGIDTTHEDLVGVVDSYDHKDSRADDLLGHGTHVSGIIAALTNNGRGISGISTSRLAVWKIFGDKPIEGDFYVDGELYLRALGLLADVGCRVVNLSIGGTQQSRSEALLFKRLRDQNVLPIAAMGNEFREGNPIEFPAAYPGVVAVGALTSGLRRASFSNTGLHIWVVAPGHTIASTVPMTKSRYREEVEYATWNGTSMATPHVAAAAALYLAKNPKATADRVEAALKRCAKPVPEMGSRKFTAAYGHGLIYLPKLI